MQRHEQPVHMEDRQRVQQHVARHETPVDVQRLGVGGDVAVGDHGALGAPGRAGGIDERRKIVGLALGGSAQGPLARRQLAEGAAAVRRHGQQRAHLVGGRCGLDLGDALGRGDDDLGLGVADEILELGRRVGGVERVVDGADLEGRKVEVDAGKRLLDLRHDTIAGLQPERLQCRRGTSDLIEQLGVGQDAPVGRLERGRVFRRAHLGFQASEKIAVAWHLADRPSGRASSSQQQRGHRGDTEARMRCGRRGKRWLKDFPGAEPEAGVYTGAWPRGNTAIGWCRSKALPDRGFEGRAKPWDIPLCAGRTALLQQASQVFFQLSTERVTALGPSANRRASRSRP